MQKRANASKWRGTELSLTIEGAWGVYRAYILRYLRQIAVITPYAHFTFEFKAKDAKHSAAMAFRRRTDVMPAPPLQARTRFFLLLVSTHCLAARTSVEFTCCSSADSVSAKIASPCAPTRSVQS